MSFRLGVDVGGTFTDLILVNEASGDIHTAKVPSTPDDSSVGVMNGVERVCANAGIDPSQISQVMHGTTVATNTVLTGTGAKVGLVRPGVTNRCCRSPAPMYPADWAVG